MRRSIFILQQQPQRPRNQPRRLCLWLAIGLGLLPLLSLGPACAAELPPLLITNFIYFDEAIQLDWQGGVAPYRVQKWIKRTYSWQNISGMLLESTYSSDAFDSMTLFRVESIPDHIPPAAPAQPTLLATRCDRIALNWPAALDTPEGSGTKDYRLYRDGLLIGQFAETNRFYFDRDVLPESTHTYNVTAVDHSGNESTWSTSLAVTTDPCLGESGPMTELTLAWDPSEDEEISGYLVYWGVAPGVYQWVLDAMDSTSVVVPGLEPDQPYFFSVTAYDQKGVQSDFCPEVTQITPPPFTFQLFPR